jgi:uncharacterized protein (TIGR03086 family)
MLERVVNALEGLIDRFLASGAEFERKLRAVRPEQWSWPTPCSEWNVRQLVNHMTRGNLSYASLLDSGGAADFVRMRDADALGTDPVGAYARSVQECAGAFGQAGAMRRMLDHPLGPVTGRQALAVRITDSTVHTWDLAQAVGADDALNGDLVDWICEHLDDIYAGLPETPTAAETTHRFFAASEGVLAHEASAQMRLLHRMGRTPAQGPRNSAPRNSSG